MAVSYEKASDLDQLTLDVATLRDILQCAPSPEVLVTVFLRGLALGEADVGLAASSSASAARTWRTGQRPSAASRKRLQDLGALAAYLLSFECFRTPEAAGRWLTMPRVSADAPGGYVTAIDQIAAGKLSTCIDDAHTMLSGQLRGASAIPADRQRASKGKRPTPSKVGASGRS